MRGKIIGLPIFKLPKIYKRDKASLTQEIDSRTEFQHVAKPHQMSYSNCQNLCDTPVTLSLALLIAGFLCGLTVIIIKAFRYLMS